MLAGFAPASPEGLLISNVEVKNVGLVGHVSVTFNQCIALKIVIKVYVFHIVKSRSETLLTLFET